MSPNDHQQFGGDHSKPEEALEGTEPDGELSSESEMLQQVLNQTLAGLTSTRELNPEVHAALLNVAQRYPNEPLTLDPIAMELVASCLRTQFPALAAREALARRMSLWVAESLLADPAARQRMTELWARLGEAHA
jgi:hypothetical protein